MRGRPPAYYITRDLAGRELTFEGLRPLAKSLGLAEISLVYRVVTGERAIPFHWNLASIRRKGKPDRSHRAPVPMNSYKTKTYVVELESGEVLEFDGLAAGAKLFGITIPCFANYVNGRFTVPPRFGVRRLGIKGGTMHDQRNRPPPRSVGRLGRPVAAVMADGTRTTDYPSIAAMQRDLYPGYSDNYILSVVCRGMMPKGMEELIYL